MHTTNIILQIIVSLSKNMNINLDYEKSLLHEIIGYYVSINL